MKKSSFFLALMLGVFFTACKQQGSMELTEVQKADIEKQVLGQWDKISAFVEKADAEGFTSFMSKDEFLEMISQGRAFNTRQEYADTVAVWFGQRKSAEIKEKVIKVTVLSEKLALLDQKSLFQANMKDGEIRSIDHFVSFLFKKEASGWMIIHGHESW